jgi:integrase
MNITEKAVAKLAPGKERIQRYDDSQTGFGVRCEVNGRKSFFWLQKVNGKPRFRALGDYPQTGVSEARDAAKVWAGVASDWKSRDCAPPDPFAKAVPVVAPSNVPTFKQMVEAYIAQHIHSTDREERANNPERAEYFVRWRLKTHFADWLSRPVDSITIQDVLAVKAACGDRKYLANRAIEFVRAAYNWSAAQPDGKINFWDCLNPAKNVTSFTETSRKIFLQPDQVVRFHEALEKEKHHDLKDFLTLAMETGARKMDILSMRWQDVHPERKTWTVPFPKNGESYDVDLSGPAITVLERREAKRTQGNGFVFPGVGRSGHLTELRKPWNLFRKRAAIPEIHTHDLRRTVGSYAAMAGKSLEQIGAMLGHRSMQSTQVYAHLNRQATREAREAGSQKMKQMMRDAKKRTKALAGKRGRLALVS